MRRSRGAAYVLDMAITNIYSRNLWAISGGRHEISVTIATTGSRLAFAETSLARVTGNGAAYAWISGIPQEGGPNGIWPDPDGAPSVQWVKDALSVTFTVRVINCYAYAVAKLSPWV